MINQRKWKDTLQNQHPNSHACFGDLLRAQLLCWKIHKTEFSLNNLTTDGRFGIANNKISNNSFANKTNLILILRNKLNLLDL